MAETRWLLRVKTLWTIYENATKPFTYFTLIIKHCFTGPLTYKAASAILLSDLKASSSEDDLKRAAQRIRQENALLHEWHLRSSKHRTPWNSIFYSDRTKKYLHLKKNECGLERSYTTSCSLPQKEWKTYDL